MGSPGLESGRLLPEILIRPPGPRARAMAGRLETSEAPGINTLVAGTTAMLWAEARGSNVVDVDGNRYVDVTAGFGVAAVGHRHPAVVAAVREQAEQLVHGLGDVYAHPARLELAERLCALAPLPAPRVYFAVSGADAVEIALKTSRLHSGRPGVLAFDPAYHGTTLGALAATSRPAFREPFTEPLEGLVHRLPYGAPSEQIQEILERQPDIGTCLVEPVIGREATRWPPPGWLPALGELCRRHEVVLAVDEIFTGFGRCGAWFVCREAGLEPDLVCCGKALGGGLPIAAVLGRKEVMDAWRSEGEARHTATFVAHPLACAAAVATLEVIESEDLVDRALTVGNRFGQALESLKTRPGVIDIRGQGLLRAIELDSPIRAQALSRNLLHRGLIALAGGASGTVLQLSPPLVITEQQLDHAVAVLHEVLAE
ncbi:MAG: aspartate aminotransferase family protein [Holophagales bacterium]|nr:aspartate aminotransferase family protein [Holophagales bacterium]MYD23703.1 aspartate aminotransferase family protein [Holophagales bacterium]MYI34632.1 aspartate aminotransferase family protein [Holophagales bacterium]